MDLSIFQDFAFPVSLVLVLGAYIAHTLKVNREDLLRREEQNRADTQRREDKLMGQIGEVVTTNKILLETNAVLAREINVKLDSLLNHKGGEVDG